MSWRSVQLREHEFFVRGVREPVRRMLIDNRWVDMWIPDVTPSGLIVAHDGQNVFDDRAATHHQTWDAARAAVRAAQRVGVAPPAVVGVWNGSTAQHPHRRGYELAPQKLMTAAMQVDPRLADWFDPLVDALIDHLPAPGDVRVWMQNGTNGLDASYAPFQRRAESRLASRGYVHGRDYVSRVLRRSGHNERSWARRLPDAIEWWLRGVAN
ncbi:MAG: hypothetical protein EBX18_04610 [Actinobacteria bacterium]|nr:hypothetical protein [Actinomycetota bacterium]